MAIRRAFSLIELLLAIFILGIGVIGIAALCPAGIAQQRQSVDDVLGPIAVDKDRRETVVNRVPEEVRRPGRRALRLLERPRPFLGNLQVLCQHGDFAPGLAFQRHAGGLDQQHHVVPGIEPRQLFDDAVHQKIFAFTRKAQRPTSAREIVLAVRAAIDRGGEIRWQAGVANLGVRPTVGGTAPLLEVYLFDFDEDLYGSHLRVALVDFQRPEVKFDSLEEMKVQMKEDERQARMTLAWEDWDAGWPASPFMAGPLD